MFLRLLSRRPWLLARAGVLSFLAAILAFAVYPHGETGRPQNSKALSEQMAMNSQTAATFSRSCADCHSNSTTWPWYSHVPPASWLIKHDVEQARKHFNASVWTSYGVAKKREILGDIARVVTNREMPAKQYLLLHRNARLSDRDGEVLVQWATSQRRLLRKMNTGESGLDNLPENGIR